MNDLMIKMYVAAKALIECEEGQDLVEYALVVALIAFGAITGMGYLATGLNHAFSTIASTLTTDVSVREISGSVRRPNLYAVNNRMPETGCESKNDCSRILLIVGHQEKLHMAAAIPVVSIQQMRSWKN